MTEQEATTLFNDRVYPAFQIAYQNMEPTMFFIDQGNLDIDGAGGVGLVGVTQGACQQADFLVRFAIAHETAHGVVAKEHLKQGTQCPEAMNANRKKHEAWADLIATKVLITQLPDLWVSVAANIDLIPNILGPATASHPSGQRRVDLIKEFVAAYNQAGVASGNFLSRLFCCCAKKPINTVLARENAFKAAFKKIDTAPL